MYTRHKRISSITHSLAPQLQRTIPTLNEQQIPVLPPRPTHPYKSCKSVNPLTQRSRKHRLLQERNTQIQKGNRMLYEKIRKIKLKNMYHSEKKIQPQNLHEDLEENKKEKNYFLPQLNEIKKSVKTSTTISNPMRSTRSQLDCILEDRKTFVSKYFTDLHQKSGIKMQEKELGVFTCQNGWKVRALLVQNKSLLLAGKKGRNELTKKYLYSKVRSKVQENLEEWVKYKFSFES